MSRAAARTGQRQPPTMVQDTAPQAVIYLRVSTKEQAEKGGEAEGYSIPAQREACKRKAASLGAVVVEEFVDRGESARSARRPELQRMLAYVKENAVAYVIVHKVDRLARNRADDVEINLALKAAGATLVSVSENIDETPSGMLLHGIMSSIAEFYSRNLANEVIKGSTEKAKGGGTIGKAPLGYLNVRKIDDGREIRTVEIDPVRGPLMQWAFEAYATGDWTLRPLLEELTRRGLTAPAGRKTPEKSLELSHFHKLLRHPYYKGLVRYRGVEYQGKHEPLVSEATWELVQQTLATKNQAGERQRVHHHYLKGSLFCGSCGSRMIITNARNRYGQVYPYFVCLGRHQKRTDCTFKAVLIETVEDGGNRALRHRPAQPQESRPDRAETQRGLRRLSPRDRDRAQSPGQAQEEAPRRARQAPTGPLRRRCAARPPQNRANKDRRPTRLRRAALQRHR